VGVAWTTLKVEARDNPREACACKHGMRPKGRKFYQDQRHERPRKAHYFDLHCSA
jgi:hypothetical protein